MTHFLVTNDDGVFAPGLLALVQALRAIQGNEVSVLAPDHNWSACGHVKTLTRPLRVREVKLADGSAALSCDGAPSDCVAIAIMGAIEKPIDVVVSGINPNANVGLDVTYSGTVTAAMEASINGKPGYAVSLDAPERHQGELNFAPAAKAAADVILGLLADKAEINKQPIWNINLPYREEGQFEGVLYTRQGVRLYRDVLEKRLDPQGKPYYWIGGEAPTGLMDEGTDYWAIKRGYISVTPLQMDMTNKPLLETLNHSKS
jgi:5'-nucleotidase